MCSSYIYPRSHALLCTAVTCPQQESTCRHVSATGGSGGSTAPCRGPGPGGGGRGGGDGRGAGGPGDGPGDGRGGEDGRSDQPGLSPPRVASH